MSNNDLYGFKKRCSNLSVYDQIYLLNRKIKSRKDDIEKKEKTLKNLIDLRLEIKNSLKKD